MKCHTPLWWRCSGYRYKEKSIIGMIFVSSWKRVIYMRLKKTKDLLKSCDS